MNGDAKAEVKTSKFTKEQVEVLHCQIQAIRKLKKNEKLTTEDINDCKPKPIKPWDHSTVFPSTVPLASVIEWNSKDQLHEPAGVPRSLIMNFNPIALLRKEREKILQEHLKAKKEAITAAWHAVHENKVPRIAGLSHRSEVMPVGKMKLEIRKLRFQKQQHTLRNEIYAKQAELAAMSESQYKKFTKTQRAQRIDAAKKEFEARSVKAAARASEAKAYKDMLSKASKESADAKIARNKLVIRAHEKLIREKNRSRMDDKTMRMEALKAHDFEAYKEMLRRQAGGSLTAGERYEAIEKFLGDTEEYLHKLAGKIASVKLTAEVSAAAATAVAAARAAGLSEEEVQAAGKAAASQAANTTVEVPVADDGNGDAQTRYYALAHSTQETITLQPSLLIPPKGASLREYQMVGLQWMVSLYNNHLNGILADEMGLGKTVQVMSLIAYLMEKKSNYGPHLIIVPNAVIVNWKSELTQWLPSVRCVYYVGSKDERARKYAQEVQSLQFNVLVTTYEFIMRDRARLSKIDWQYIVIDEAQRMKDRQSKLAKDLDRFNSVRRLLLSGTPLQNDLLELWSLLNLLLPDVFDDKSTFTDWFGDAIAATSQGDGADWLEKEKRVVVIHRLHQILEPFMLRRQVEDVESKLPPKVALTIKVAPTPYQSAIYDWVRVTGTLRLDPLNPLAGKHGRTFASLNNKCMELRKVCNHPLLSYPPPTYAVGDAIVRHCGKFLALDRLLIKLRASGHKVLLFSTMTKLLDLLEVYLQWRELPEDLIEGISDGRMKYLRIDGSTALEDRESAIQRFNAPDSDTFIFLLSIRAAGRGLNLQSADTVIVYDPDPNPKNEEQAIARSHRIGQTREVRVIHLESVSESFVSQNTGETHEDGRKLWADSIESLVRNQIQRMKIEMANEIIDAGRFDQQTSNAERRQTLETLLSDQERNTRPQNVVPTWSELNKQVARTDAELELFDKLDEREEVWFKPTQIVEAPHWLLWTPADANQAASESMKVHKPDIQAELAALTGTVLHHHAPPVGPGEVAAGPVTAAVMEKRPVAAQPTATVTTTKSLTGMSEMDEEEVDMVDNDEEEEVLEQNNLTDDIDGEQLHLPRIQSTAASPLVLNGEHGEGEPEPKRAKGLRFEQGAMDVSGEGGPVS